MLAPGLSYVYIMTDSRWANISSFEIDNSEILSEETTDIFPSAEIDYQNRDNFVKL